MSINKVGVRDTEGESNITSGVNKGELRARFIKMVSDQFTWNMKEDVDLTERDEN